MLPACERGLRRELSLQDPERLRKPLWHKSFPSRPSMLELHTISPPINSTSLLLRVNPKPVPHVCEDRGLFDIGSDWQVARFPVPAKTIGTSRENFACGDRITCIGLQFLNLGSILEKLWQSSKEKGGGYAAVGDWTFTVSFPEPWNEFSSTSGTVDGRRVCQRCGRTGAESGLFSREARWRNSWWALGRDQRLGDRGQ